MNKLAFPALFAIALAASGCTNDAGVSNAVVSNDSIFNDTDRADANFSATDPVVGNADDSNANASSDNAL